MVNGKTEWICGCGIWVWFLKIIISKLLSQLPFKCFHSVRLSTFVKAVFQLSQSERYDRKKSGTHELHCCFHWILSFLDSGSVFPYDESRRCKWIGGSERHIPRLF